MKNDRGEDLKCVGKGGSENTSSVLRERKIYIECVYSKRERVYQEW